MKITGRDWFFIFLLLLSSLFATKALIHPGFFTSHDGPHQVVRLYYYQAALRDGQLPPRYLLDSLHGFGYPLFIFSYHLPWLLAMPFLWLGVSLYDCLKLLFILSFVCSGLTMYFWQRAFWASRWAGFIAAFLYLWAPYRFVDIFVRGSLGESWTFVFLPLLFYSLQGSTFKAVILGGVALAGLILSHLLIFLLTLPALLLFLLWLFLENRSFSANLKKFKLNLLIFALGLGLTAFYLLPAVFLKQETVFNQLMAGTTTSFNDHFPTFKQLLYSPWGYGFSFPGTNDAMSFQVGVGQWLVAGASILFISWQFFKEFKNQKSKIKMKIQNAKITIAIIFVLLFSYSLLMMQPISRPVWQVANKFAYIDYPWRYLFLTVFSASVLGGWLVARLNSIHLKLLKGFKKLRLTPAILAGLVLISVCLYANRNHLRVNAWLDWPPQSFVGDGDTSNTFEEYTPRWADRQYLKTPRPLIEILQGEGQATKVIKKSQRLSFEAENKTESRYRVNLLYFPEVSLTVDGQPQNYQYQDKGVLDFSLPAGKHQVVIEYQKTRLEKIGMGITILNLLLLGYFFLKFKN
jgi:hypothetical protein